MIILSSLMLACLMAPAHAYLDPGSGSMLMQLILGGVAGAVVLLRMYWRKLLMLQPFKIKKSKNDEPKE
jgi:hypothetical protein